MKITKNATIYFNSSTEMNEILDNSIALVVTSPPYFNFIEYGKIGIGTEKDYQNYLDNLELVFRECFRVLIPDGKTCINITNMKARKDVEGKSFVYSIVADVTKIMQKIGFTFWDEVIWVKGDANNGALKGKPLFGSYPYPPNPKMLDSIFENIIIFKKEGKLDQRVSKEKKEVSKVTKQEWAKFTKGVWMIPPDRSLHPASFPFELPYRLIKIYTFVGETVLDPFAGTGTTLAAAEKLQRKSIGYEIFKGYEILIMKRFEDAKNEQLSLIPELPDDSDDEEWEAEEDMKEESNKPTQQGLNWDNYINPKKNEL
jgi:modification methylase